MKSYAKFVNMPGAFILAFLCLAGTLRAQTWAHLSPKGQIPPLHAGEGNAVYNPNANQFIIFGGGNPRTNDVLILSNANGYGGTPVWTQLPTSGGGPDPRAGHSLIYDPGSNRLIVFAGCTDSGCANLLNDVWVLSNANGLESATAEWTQLSPSGTPPTPRAEHSAVYDTQTNRMVVFGGCTRGPFGCDVPQNDAWVLTNATGLGGSAQWIRLTPTSGLPGPRASQAASFDPNTNRMTIFGGAAGHVGVFYGDVWILKNANGLNPPQWVQLHPGGFSNPEDRYNQATVYDSGTNELITFSGVSGGNLTNDVWILSHANGSGGSPAWRQVSPSGTSPSRRQNALCAFDSVRRRMMIFGGDNLNDSWVLVRP